MSRDRARGHACRTRQEAAVAWTSAHAMELAGVGLPLVGGLLWTSWLDLISGVVALLWARHELLVFRRTRAARRVRHAVAVPGARPARRLTTGPADTATDDETGPASARGRRREVTR